MLYRSTLLSFLILSVGYILLNPWWFGDAIWYATDISSNPPFLVEPGHVLWRPLGLFVWKLLVLVVPSTTPLFAFQFICSVLSAGGVAIFFAVCLELGLEKRSSLLATVMYAGSHFMVSYAGSGSSYAPSLSFLLAAFYFALRPELRFSKTLSILSVVMAWGLWSITSLTVLGIGYAAALQRRKPLIRDTLLYAFSAGALCLTLCFLAYLSADKVEAPENSFVQWLVSSGHGIPARLSFSNTLRALLGAFLTHIYLFDIGTQLKLALYRRTLSSVSPSLGAALTACLIFSSLFGLSLWHSLRRLSAASSRQGVVTASLSLAPILLFGLIWQGSDIERLCFLIPVTSFLFGFGLQRSFLLKVAAILIVGSNLGFRVFPTVFSGGGESGQLTRLVENHTKPHSLLVIHGQRFSISSWTAAQYFSKRDFHSILYDVQTNGEKAWQKRLNSSMTKAWENGGAVWVLAPLLSTEHTSQAEHALQMNPEFPVPSVSQVCQFFMTFQKTGRSFSIGKLEFLEISHERERAEVR